MLVSWRNADSFLTGWSVHETLEAPWLPAAMPCLSMLWQLSFFLTPACLPLLYFLPGELRAIGEVMIKDRSADSMLYINASAQNLQVRLPLHTHTHSLTGHPALQCVP